MNGVLVRMIRDLLGADQTRQTPGSNATGHESHQACIQALMEGMQEVRVQAVTPPAEPGHGQISMRLVGIRVRIKDREAVDSLLDAWRQAADLGDKAFGVVLPPPAYMPRPRQ